MNNHKELMEKLDKYESQRKLAEERFGDRLPRASGKWPGQAAAAIREQAAQLERLRKVAQAVVDDYFADQYDHWQEMEELRTELITNGGVK